MKVFVDTSALISLLDRDDGNHARAAKAFEKLRKKDAILVCSNYVLVETCAIIQHRLGLGALRSFQKDFFPLLVTVWVDEDIHMAATSAVLAAGKRRLSLVDCSSFEVMRRSGIDRAFTFDRHFQQQGFSCLP
ncbi:MAG: PIN domain-containing protein [Deltaproteobacteria bacterium]|nr:MAG: PIN domain-containing protein [Deltaproteobacteria bacterium]